MITQRILPQFATTLWLPYLHGSGSYMLSLKGNLRSAEIIIAADYWRRRMKKFAAGVVTTIMVLVAVSYLYLASGMAPVATSARPMPFEKKLAHIALHARLDREMPRQVPLMADEQNLTAGAHIYMEQCAVCHGVPDQEQSAIAKGEFPPPPHLFRGKG